MLLHQFDNTEDWTAGRGWAPCHSGWCAGRIDHLSCSLVNKQHPTVFNGNGGIVLAPFTKIACAFNADGGTQSRSTKDACRLGTAYSPDQLKQALQSQGSGRYNEIVVENKAIDLMLPNVVEAIFYMGNAGKARAAHRAFLRAYGRTEAQTPLLRYSPGSGFSSG